MKHVLEREQFVPRPRSEVFQFFSDASNLERLTPKVLHFRILTPLPIVMCAGARIEYRIALFGVPFGWQTLIESFEPETSFVDRQVRGPYAHWHHTHTFDDAPGGTLMRDRVVYEVPFGPFGEVARHVFVDRQLAAIFDYRREAVDEVFGKGRRSRLIGGMMGVHDEPRSPAVGRAHVSRTASVLRGWAQDLVRPHCALRMSGRTACVT